MNLLSEPVEPNTAEQMSRLCEQAEEVTDTLVLQRLVFLRLSLPLSLQTIDLHEAISVSVLCEVITILCSNMAEWKPNLRAKNSRLLLYSFTINTNTCSLTFYPFHLNLNKTHPENEMLLIWRYIVSDCLMADEKWREIKGNHSW